jgi:hypothetical protein
MRRLTLPLAATIAVLGVTAPAGAASSTSAIHATVDRVARSTYDGDTGACALETAGFQRWFVQTARIAGVRVSTCQQAVAQLPRAYARAHALPTVKGYAQELVTGLDRASVSYSGNSATLIARLSTGPVKCVVQRSGSRWLVASVGS